MFSKFVFSPIAAAIVVAFAASAAFSQDLGSSNKLFGAKAAPSAPAAKKRTRKAAAPKPRGSAAKTTTGKARPAKPTASAPPKKDASAGAKWTASSEKAASAAKAKPQVPDTASAAKPEKKPAAAKPLASKDLDKLIEEGNQARDRRDLWTAEEKYRQALAAAPDYTYVKVALSEVLTQPVPVAELVDRYEESERLARSAVEKEPKNAVAHDRLGVALETRGLTGQETEDLYRRAISLDETYAPAYAHLARLMRRRGKTADAVSLYGEALERARDAKTLTAIAETMQSEQKYADSVGPLLRAIRMDARNTPALDLLGRAQTSAGNFADARATLRKSIDIEPRNVNAYMLLANVHFREDDLSSAEDALVRASKFAKGFDRLRLAGEFERLGDLYSRTDKRAEARRSYKQALTFAPERESVLSKLSARK